MTDSTADIATVVLAVVTALGGQHAWGYYQKRLELRKVSQGEEREEKRSDASLYREDLRTRVDELSELLKESQAKHDESQDSREKLLLEMGELRSEVAALRVKVEHLETQNVDLKARLSEYQNNSGA